MLHEFLKGGASGLVDASLVLFHTPPALHTVRVTIKVPPPPLLSEDQPKKYHLLEPSHTTVQWLYSYCPVLHARFRDLSSSFPLSQGFRGRSTISGLTAFYLETG